MCIEFDLFWDPIDWVLWVPVIGANMGSAIGNPHPIEIRGRDVPLVEQGNVHTETGRGLCVSIKFVKDMVRLSRQTGVLDRKQQGNSGRSVAAYARYGTPWHMCRAVGLPSSLHSRLSSDHACIALSRLLKKFDF